MRLNLPSLLRLSLFTTLAALSHSALAQSGNSVYARVANSVGIVIIMTYEGELVGSGSAVTVASQTMVTNHHVLMPGYRYQVLINGGRYEGYMSTCDSDQDLCLLSVKGLEAQPVEFGDVSKINVGDPVYTLGFPNEIGNVVGVSEATKQKSYTPLQSTLSNGLITALRPVDGGSIIQTNAAISPGSSGGGLFDANGRLLGITTFGMKYGQGLNMALPVNWVARLGVSGAPHPADIINAAAAGNTSPPKQNSRDVDQTPSNSGGEPGNFSSPNLTPAESPDPFKKYKDHWWYAIPAVLIALLVVKRVRNRDEDEAVAVDIPRTSATPQLQSFMEAASKELDEQRADTALWQMVLNECKGNESLARESYIKYRATKLRSIEKDKQWAETARQT
ncbi:MAG TPA: serine protease [Rhodocyclaceae bacterium]|nr:serine protease [Rhodocyclaceae bacterium]